GASWVASLSLKSFTTKEGVRLVVEAESGLSDPLTMNQLQVLRNVEPVEGKPGTFRSQRHVRPNEVDALLDEVLDRRLLYYPYQSAGSTPVGNLAGLLPVEEFPLILAFYHMSSVAR